MLKFSTCPFPPSLSVTPYLLLSVSVSSPLSHRLVPISIFILFLNSLIVTCRHGFLCPKYFSMCFLKSRTSFYIVSTQNTAVAPKEKRDYSESNMNGHGSGSWIQVTLNNCSTMAQVHKLS
jgi:hypothetical protein